MTALKRRLHTILLASALTLTGIVNPASADTLKLPKEKPEFTLDLPDGWTHEAKSGGMVNCAPPDNSKGYYALFVTDMADVHSKADAKKKLSVIAKDFAAGANITDLQTADMDDLKNSNDVPFTGLVGKGMKKDLVAVVVVHAFEVQKGKWYVIMTLGTEAGDKAYSDEYTSIVDSVQPLK